MINISDSLICQILKLDCPFHEWVYNLVPFYTPTEQYLHIVVLLNIIHFKNTVNARHRSICPNGLLYTSNPKKKVQKSIKRCHQKADLDGNGFLTAEECCKYLKEHKINYSKKHVEFMMKMANHEDPQ